MLLDFFSSNKEQLSKFAVVGVLGNLVGWLIYTGIYHSLAFEIYKPTISWAISFHFGVIIQHFLHRRYTFSENLTPYLPSLIKTYLSYLVNFVVCLFSNLLFNEYFQFYHHVAWLLTLLISIPISFIMLKYYAFHRGESQIQQ